MTDSNNWFLNFFIFIMLTFIALALAIVLQYTEIKDLEHKVNQLSKMNNQTQISDLQKENISQNIQIEMLWDTLVSGEIPKYYIQEGDY